MSLSSRTIATCCVTWRSSRRNRLDSKLPILRRAGQAPARSAACVTSRSVSDPTCLGVSTQLHQQVPSWDELIQPGDADFPSSGLHCASIIRLSYLHATDPTEFAGAIGQVDAARLDRLLTRLADHLHP